MLYFDASYVMRLYFLETGWERVRALAATDTIACCLHGQAETMAAFHRKFRENSINHAQLNQLLGEFERDCESGAFVWLPLSPAIIERVFKVFAKLPVSIHLRAADAIHLACAAENSLRVIYSNDARQLAGASEFGIKGLNII